MKISKEQIVRLIKEEIRREAQQPTIQGVHPLIDGMYLGNGSMPSVFKRVPEAVEIMEANPEVEEFKLALSIINTGKPLPYLPFRFEKKIAEALAAHGASSETVAEVEMFGAFEDDEYNPPGW